MRRWVGVTRYITPHFVKRAAVVREAHFVPPTASRPTGLQNEALCKVRRPSGAGALPRMHGRLGRLAHARQSAGCCGAGRFSQSVRFAQGLAVFVSALRARGASALVLPPRPPHAWRSAPTARRLSARPPPPQGGAPTRRRRAFAPCASRTAPLVCRQGSGLRPRHKGAPSCRLSRGRGTGVRFASLPSGAAPPIPRNRQAGRAAPCRRPALFMLAFLSFPLAT